MLTHTSSFNALRLPTDVEHFMVGCKPHTAPDRLPTFNYTIFIGSTCKLAIAQHLRPNATVYAPAQVLDEMTVNHRVNFIQPSVRIDGNWNAHRFIRFDCR